MRPNLQEFVDLVIFTEEILNRKLDFFCSEKEKTYSIGYFQNNIFNSERFLKTTEPRQVEINELAIIDTSGNFVDTPRLFQLDKRR